MKTARLWSLLVVAIAAGFLVSAFQREAPAASARQPLKGEFLFGMLLVGPYNDHGWSQSNFEAGKYVERKCPGARMLYVDKVNPTDRPGTTAAQLAGDLASKGARVIIFSSDDMKDDAVEFARRRPDLIVIHTSGDSAWKEGKDYKHLPNLGNVMGRMEYGEMIAGFAAALTTKTGKIGYLGPLINDETRRLAAATYLGARHCWVHCLGKDPRNLSFKVTWIGYWFNLPGVTADPTRVTADFYNSGYDVVVSGIDTTEALAEAKKQKSSGKEAWAIPYNFRNACSEGEEVCLGVPYFNWGPAYLRYINSARGGTWKPSWDWIGPHWREINDPDVSAIGFLTGAALSPRASAKVDEFIKSLGAGLDLWRGPLDLQDGTPYLKDGQAATDPLIWYLPQLLKGMEGQSVSK